MAKKTLTPNFDHAYFEIMNGSRDPKNIGYVRYIDNTNKIEQYKYPNDGSRNWLTNNPYLIPKKHAANMGMIGAVDGIAIFPSEAKGVEAFQRLLKQPQFRDLTLADVIAKIDGINRDITETPYTKPANKVVKLVPKSKIKLMVNQILTRYTKIETNAKAGSIAPIEIMRITKCPAVKLINSF